LLEEALELLGLGDERATLRVCLKVFLAVLENVKNGKTEEHSALEIALSRLIISRGEEDKIKEVIR
jgi:hypothetical protein